MTLPLIPSFNLSRIRFEGAPAKFAMGKFSYYLCYKCSRSYGAGDKVRSRSFGTGARVRARSRSHGAGARVGVRSRSYGEGAGLSIVPLDDHNYKSA